MKEALKKNLNKKLWDINLKAFDLGYEAANKQAV
jgi:Pyruvate/2-oxoacid:ferredoxin oxidoreductase gamma subunit